MKVGRLISRKTLFYGLMLLAVCGLFLYPGYVFMLDFVFVPNMTSQEFIDRPSYLFHLTIDVLGNFLPSALVQRIVIAGTFIVCVFGIRQLFKYTVSSGVGAEGAIFGVFMYVVNPFVYSRFMTGQIAVLLGYALIPFFVVSLIRLLEQLSWRRAVIVALWCTLISIISIHTLGLLVVVVAPIIGLYVYRHRRDLRWVRNFTLWFLVCVGTFLVTIAYWLIPTLMGEGNIAQTVASFSAPDFAAFATNGDNLGVLGNVLTMQGFWADAANLYLTPEDIYSWWLIPLCALGLLVILGVFRGWRLMRGLTIAFICMFVAAVVLATGPSGSIFALMNEWLLNHVPFFAGYREPQKFVAIVVLAYTVFASLGVQQLAEWFRKRSSRHDLVASIGILALIIPLACTPLMPQGLSDTLRGSDYPRDWYDMNNYFEHNLSEGEKVLALPWHMYMRFEFAGRVIANPMDKFFTPKLIINEDPEYKSAGSYARSDERQTMKQALGSTSSLSDIGIVSKLRQQDTHYILVAKEFDYQEYDYLKNQRYLKVVRDTKTLRLYKIETGSIE